MKSLLPIILLLTLAACASPGNKTGELTAQIMSIRQVHDSYKDGGFAFFTVVTYRILDSEQTIERWYAIEASELKSIAVGKIVMLKE